jgi:hypothetical protein
MQAHNRAPGKVRDDRGDLQFNFRTIMLIAFQGLAAMMAFVVSPVIANMLIPLSAAIMSAAASATGFLPAPLAFVFGAAANALVLVWAARRSSEKGLRMAAQLFVLSFGAQVLETQIETGYFSSAFPLLQGNFQVYVLILRGLVTSLLFSMLVTWICGGFSRRPRPQTRFTATAARAVRQAAWLAAVYVILYVLFGYFVAWQVRELRLFYGGPPELNGLFQQWGLTLMAKPELPVFQYFRGVLWILCLIPLFRGFSGGRAELVVLSALALGLLPTAQMAFANPLMPAAVSLGHFWEVAISTGIFGMLCAWFVPPAVRSGYQGA